MFKPHQMGMQVPYRVDPEMPEEDGQLRKNLGDVLLTIKNDEQKKEVFLRIC